MAYTAILTTLGLAKIADAIANATPLQITTGKVGDGNGNPTTPAAADTDLVRVVYSTALNRLDVDTADETRIVAEWIVPAAEGGWTVREIGLYDIDDDLIAVAQFPEVYKPTASEGASLDLVIRLYLAVSNASAIELIIDTSVVLATRSWVTDNFSGIPGGTTDQILKKVSNANFDYIWANPDDVNVVIEVIEEEQTLAASQTTVTLATAGTDNAAVYIDGVRLHPDDWTATSATVITLATSYAAGSKILVVQNDPTGGAEYLKRAQNLADLADKDEARTNLELLTNETYLNALWALMKQRDYPVGEILETRRAGNPATWLGFGTWERYGKGRVKVGYDEADASFNALDKTGGAKTHTLTVAELPPHSHTIDLRNSGGDGRDTGFAEEAGNLNYPRVQQTQNTGGGQAHNNLQPYVVVFMWKRTA